jgi:prepilin-type N-terminal cleavage/methylation domain-containing protein
MVLTRVRRSRHGFTLIEVLVVVVILGILAGIVLGRFKGAADDSARAAFVTCGQSFRDAAMRYYIATGAFPPNAASGVLPSGFGAFIGTASYWKGHTPIGGLWDMETNSFGVACAVGVHFKDGTGPAKDDAYMQEIDAAIDDGDLDAGGFRKLGDKRYYFVVAN